MPNLRLGILKRIGPSEFLNSKGRNSIHQVQEIYLPQIQVFSTGWSETAMDSIRFFDFHSGLKTI